MLKDEYQVNLDRIEKEFPGSRLLSKTQMSRYLGCKASALEHNFGIKGKLTKESFRMRLVKGKDAT